MERQPNTQYVLSLSYGKDSLACLEAIKRLGYPLDRIVHAEVWATDTIPADLPPMVEFKAHADRIIKEKYGIEVEHICAMKNGEKVTYEKIFYCVPKRRNSERERERESIEGFPSKFHLHCNSKLKRSAILGSLRIPQTTNALLSKPTQGGCSRQVFTASQYPSGEEIGVLDSNRGFSSCPIIEQGAKINTVQYLGIAADEPERISRHSVPGKVLPLVDIGWTEADCRKWCEENDLLSPIYTTSARGGCWFCHNQGIDQLRLLRKEYPDLWELLLKWDSDSPVSFKSDGHTVHDYDRRFQAEEEGKVPKDRKFRWSMLEGGGHT